MVFRRLWRCRAGVWLGRLQRGDLRGKTLVMLITISVADPRTGRLDPAMFKGEA